MQHKSPDCFPSTQAKANIDPSLKNRYVNCYKCLSLGIVFNITDQQD